MCGIVGEFCFSNIDIDLKIFNRMLSCVKERGPDHSDVFLDKKIRLGHSRLSVIDLTENSNQPFCDENSGMVIVYNGTIYNYKRLRNELRSKGHIFKSEGDTEVVLKSFIQWGHDCPNYFEGDFSFAIWDKKKEELYIARDRFGVKPLYYTFNNNFFRFSSNTKALLVNNDIDKTIDIESLHYHFSLHSVVPSPNTILKDIKKLEPGTYLVIGKNNRLKKKEYWSLLSNRDKNILSSEEESEEMVRHFLEDAISKRLNASDEDVGILLSGGLDSSLIVALSHIRDKKIKTFSIGFDDQPEEIGSEFEFSDLVAQKYKTEHKRFLIPNSSVLNRIPEAFEKMPEPMVAQDAIGFYLLSELVSDEVKVVLCGQGADEVFAGYFWYKKMSEEKNVYDCFSKYYIDRSHDEINQMLDLEISHDFTSRYIEKEFSKMDEKENLLRKILNFDVTKLIIDDPVKRVDSMTMPWGLEARVPFLDHILVEHAEAIDPNLHILEDGKNILKRIGRKLLPNEIVSRTKGYFPMPALKYIRGDYYDFVYDILNSTNCCNRGLYNRKYVNRLLEKPNEYKTAINGNKLWHMAATELWLQLNVDR